MSNSAFAKDKGSLLTTMGLIAMTLLVFTQFVPSLKIAGYSVLVGLACFFIVESITKTPDAQSGLRFKTFMADIKKPGVLPLMLLPILTSFATLFLGDYIFSGGYSAHINARTDSILAFDNFPLLLAQFVFLGLGEEISWRGFFLGKSMQRYPFWPCAIVSSALFALAHLASGNIWIVLYDVFFVFVDSVIYSVVYRKSGNCLMSTIAHVLCNWTGAIIVFTLL